MRSFPNLLLGLEGDLPRATAERCLRHWHRRSTCAGCLEVCPEGALSLEGGLRLDSDRCVGCMLCVSACPTGALDWRDGGEGLLGRLKSLVAAGQSGEGEASAAPTGPRILIACTESGAEEPDSHSMLRVPCIGCVSSALILLAVAWGGEGVLLDNRSCAACSWRMGPALAGRSLTQAERVLEVCSPGARPRLAGGHGLGEAGQVSRRGFLSKLGRRIGEATALALLPEEGPPPRAVPRQSALPRERAWLSSALELMGPPSDLEAKVDGLPFYPMSVSGEKCDGCAFCGKFCPTGAVQVQEEENDWRLVFRLHRCVGCGLCLDTCPQEALSWADLIDLRQMGAGESVLAAGHSRLCPACRRATVRRAEETVCARCKSQQELEESFLELIET